MILNKNTCYKVYIIVMKIVLLNLIEFNKHMLVKFMLKYKDFKMNIPKKNKKEID